MVNMNIIEGEKGKKQYWEKLPKNLLEFMKDINWLMKKINIKQKKIIYSTNKTQS